MKKLFGVITGIVAAGILLFLGAGTVRAEAHDDHCICGGNGTCIATATAENGHTANTPAGGWQSASTYDEFKSLITNTPANGEVFIYLDASFTMGAQLVVEGGRSVHICLNGKTLTAVKNNRFFYFKSGTTLTICDCSSEKTGTMTGHADSVGRNDVNGGNMYLESCTFHLYSGTLTNGRLDTKSGTRRGGNICGEGTNAVLRIYGGTVSGGRIQSSTTTENAGYGGNIQIIGGTLYVHGGTVSGGTTTTTKGYGGNIALYTAAKVVITGGDISGGTAYKGGGIYVEGTSSTVTVSSGKIHGGTAVDRGGCIYHYSGTTTLKGGEVYGGVLTGKGGRGGNIALDGGSGTLNISGTAKIYGGTVGVAGSSTDARGGNIFCGNGYTVNVSENCEIYGGVCQGTSTGASVVGGNADFQGSFIMTGGTFTGGTAKGTDGASALYITGGSAELYNCTVTGGNATAGRAGSIFVSGGTLLLSDTSVGGATGVSALGAVFSSGNGVTVAGTSVIESLYLASGKTVTLSALQTGASVGVTLQDGTGTVAENAAASDAGYVHAGEGLSVIYKEDEQKIEIVPES